MALSNELPGRGQMRTSPQAMTSYVGSCTWIEDVLPRSSAHVVNFRTVVDRPLTTSFSELWTFRFGSTLHAPMWRCAGSLPRTFTGVFSRTTIRTCVPAGESVAVPDTPEWCCAFSLTTTVLPALPLAPVAARAASPAHSTAASVFISASLRFRVLDEAAHVGHGLAVRLAER